MVKSITTESCSQSVCEGCGASFGCGARESGCWCAAVKLSAEALAELRERYSSCLCRACLERLAAREEEGTALGREKIFD